MAVYLRTLAVCIVLFSSALCIPQRLLYDFSTGESHQLPRDDDASSPRIPLKVPVAFYGNKFDSLYVNSNGLVSFLAEIPTFINTEFPLPDPLIAPLYSNIDTRAAGTIHYYETDDPATLQRATETIHDTFTGSDDFQAASVFVVTWENVGYHKMGSDKVNTFQIVISSDGDDTYVEFLYPEGGIQWIQGTGDKETGLPDARAQAGFMAPDGRYFTLPGSGTDQVFNLDKRSNMNVPGQWIFRVGQVEPNSSVDEPDSNDRVGLLSEPVTCASSATYCHSQAVCQDYDGGICCKCKSSFYGNGRNCIMDSIPLRVNGKINGKINGIPLNNLDLQSYVVMDDARAYTAVSDIPQEIGFDIQSLYILGSTIGWVFAKPSSEAQNGYQLTGGVFNQTATIYFTNTSQQINIIQKYIGLDAFGQLKIETYIDGEIPRLPQDSQISIADYQELFTITSPGVILASSSHQFSFISSSNEEVVYTYRIEQNIVYDYCKFESLPSGTTYRLKVGRYFIGYDNRESIIRYGMSNKIGPSDETDPCTEGRTTCGPNSACVVDGDAYQCVCYPGFQKIYRENQDVCIDIDECQAGLHNCDVNARCVNEIGRFDCECNPGYEGDGRTCKGTTTCDTLRCPDNSRCVEENGPKCRCVEGYTGNGWVCTSLDDQDRNRSCAEAYNCSPYGMCSYNDEIQDYICSCIAGYVGDGYQCTRDEATTTEYYERVTQRCLFNLCWCSPGYVVEEGTNYCIPGDSSTEPFNETATTPANDVCRYCHSDAQCIYSEEISSYYCACNSGFEGDGKYCRRQEISCAQQYNCDPHASCIYSDEFKKSICVCAPGYDGDGYTCHLAATCGSSENCPETEECAYTSSSNRYECICKEGLARDSQNHCVKLEGTCGGGVCVENAECLYDDEYQTFYCSCKSDYVGDGITECKPRPIGCNVVNNCGLNAVCAYEPQLNFYQCKCEEGFFGDGFVCYKEKDCHIDPYICDVHASCVTNASRKYVCECNTGYTGNGTICKENPKYDGNFLLLNQGMATFKIPFDASRKNPGKLLHIEQQMAIGLDIDCLGGRIYWSDISSHSIKSIAYNGSGKIDFVKDSQVVGSPEGISIDWVSRNIYWTDSTKHTIEIANMETKLRRTLIDTNLINPRGIAVHPQRGKIFWTDWDRRNPKIEWANSDGTGREIFLQGENVQLPNSLAIDFQTEQLCYADAGTKKINCVWIDSKQVQNLAVNCTYPFGIAVTDKVVYWSDWISKKIERIDKQSLERLPPIQVPLGLGGKLYGLVAVPEQCPYLTNVCQFYRDQCPSGHVCVPNGSGSRNCLCGRKIDSPLEQPICNY